MDSSSKTIEISSGDIKFARSLEDIAAIVVHWSIRILRR